MGHPRQPDRCLLLASAIALVAMPGGLLSGCHGSEDRTSPPAAGTPLALVGGTLIDGRGGAPVPGVTVVLRGGRIEAVGPVAEVVLAPDVRPLDVSGAFVLPGLINTHVHNTLTAGNLETWAQAGVTTVRDVGAREASTAVFAYRERAASEPRYPRIIAAGPLVTVPGGYPIAYWGFPALAVTSPENARQEIERLADEGADFIKIALEPTSNDAPIPMLSPEEVRAITETAHRRGLTVSAHVTLAQPMEMVVDAGIDDAAHVAADAMSDALIQKMVARGVSLVPTLEAMRGWAASAGDNVRRFAAAGGLIALGNDSGYLENCQVGLPQRELSLLHANGLSTMQVLLAATRDAARVCRRADTLGTIEVGKAADILVVRRSPLDDLNALAEVRLVIHAGVVIRREAAAGR